MTKATALSFQANASTTFNVRMFDIDGQPWFVATDACRALGFDLSGGSYNHIRKLDADERQPLPRNLVPGNGRGMAQATLISEAGLYKLIAKSDKPAAKAFDRWIRHEVLPSIRKTGGYLLNEQARDTAHASDRQAMPLPEEFAQLFATVLQQQSQLAARS
ncbi:BRO-N domain-containing protein [Shinella sp.]|jgi:prophage antirepressor-like protein|uniref:BRO-N domain-containing protein n=1 Tax=Shinella sp. TaxID=1870904 RepID=UPI003F72483A